jgi:very-short-patch-repair endonuclease
MAAQPARRPERDHAGSIRRGIPGESTRRGRANDAESVDRGHGRIEDGIDWAIARLASRQHGVVSRRQLLAAGLTKWAIEWRIASGSLHVVHRGVYRVGHRAAGKWAREMAAVLACGRDAVISHRTAGRMWALLADEKRGEIDVTVCRSRAPNRPGVRARRTGSLESRDVSLLDRIPVTSPARTLLDLASVVRPHVLERALAESQVRRLVDRQSIADQLRRHPSRPGIRALRRICELERGPSLTRSEAERRMLQLLRAAELPQSLLNAKAGRYEVDFLWPEQRVVLEVDGYAYHSNRRAFERDRRRDATLAASGYTVLRVTWRQLVEAPEAVVARLAATLAPRDRPVRRG